MRQPWPRTHRNTAAVSVLHYGPCWCRGKPGDDGTLDLFRHRTVHMDLGPLDTNVMIVSDRILSGAEGMCEQVYESLPQPSIVVSTAPCPSARAFWDQAPLSWTPVRELLPVDLEVDACVSGEPEALLGALLPLVGVLEQPRFPTALQQTGA